jgi:hypothetical protein
MNETINAMVETLKETGADYIRVGLGAYSVIVAETGTAELIDKFMDEVQDE